MLNSEKTLQVGVEFCVANGRIAQYIQRMLPKHVIELEIGSTTAGLTRILGTTAESSLEVLND